MATTVTERFQIVMVGLVPTIHDFLCGNSKVVDGRPSPTMTVKAAKRARRSRAAS